MKPKAFLTVVLLMLTSIFSWGQNPVRTITASFDKIPLSEAIKTIENTSDYRFFYEIENIDFTQKVSLKAKAMPAEQAVGKMLSTTDLDFKIVAQQIVLFKKKTAVAGHSGEVLVNGTIVDINGEPLIGVVVANESGSRSTVSDVDGKFSIKADGNDKLLVSCLGYNSQTLSPKSTMKIVLEESSMSLDALVVVGYGSQKKANLLGAVSQVTAEEFKDRPVSNLGKALQGAIPNLNITYGSGLPGQETGLNIRGVASINGSGAPLVLIDGVEGSIDRVNPNDVESVSVLKDAASAAIYGARAGFGVILITTKSSKDGTAHISYNGRFSFSEPTASTDFVQAVITQHLSWMSSPVHITEALTHCTTVKTIASSGAGVMTRRKIPHALGLSRKTENTCTTVTLTGTTTSSILPSLHGTMTSASAAVLTNSIISSAETTIRRTVCMRRILTSTRPIH